MRFRTEIPVVKNEATIGYDRPVFLIGSCFSDNIGDKLRYFKFKTQVNPYGVIFNPLAIEQAISDIAAKKEYLKTDIYHYNDIWLSFNHHTSFSAANAETILENINNAISIAHDTLKNASHIFITLGTAWVYRFLATGTIVANCHKIPQREFAKELLNANEINQSLNTTIGLLKKINKNISIIFTVSPVRHLRDGFIENQLSKALLISAVQQVVKTNDSIYFPSYEIMMDDLRDYRFYNEDMVHPNELGITYIWEKFKEAFLSESTLETVEEINAIQKRMAHIPFNPESADYKKFMEVTQAKVSALTKKYPDITF